jgi:hypothetical protein
MSAIEAVAAVVGALFCFVGIGIMTEGTIRSHTHRKQFYVRTKPLHRRLGQIAVLIGILLIAAVAVSHIQDAFEFHPDTAAERSSGSF